MIERLKIAQEKAAAARTIVRDACVVAMQADLPCEDTLLTVRNALNSSCQALALLIQELEGLGNNHE